LPLKRVATSTAGQAETERDAKQNEKRSAKIKSKSVGCVNAPNLSIVIAENRATVHDVTAERRRFYRRRRDNILTANAAETPANSDDVKAAAATVTSRDLKSVSRTASEARSRRLNRLPVAEGGSKDIRSRSSHLGRSHSNVKRPTELNAAPPASANAKVKRSATFGGPDVVSRTVRKTDSTLLRRFRQQLTPRMPTRRIRRKSFDGSSASLTGRAVGDDVEATGSMESFVTACGDSSFAVNKITDASPLLTGGEPVIVSGCPTNSDNNVSAADDSDRMTWAPSSSDAHVGRSSSSCIKDYRSPTDVEATGSRRDLMSFPIVDDDDDPFDFEEEVVTGRRGSSSDGGTEAKVSVPISICLVIIAVYIIGGSALFAVWEGWDYLTGSYFCFVTLSTIGFGDVVPGTDMDQWASHEKLVLCVLWLAFGLSLLAMCFNLMQEEVKEKCKWLGRKLGLLKDEGAR
jgi:hypothetical protein